VAESAEGLHPPSKNGTWGGMYRFSHLPENPRQTSVPSAEGVVSCEGRRPWGGHEVNLGSRRLAPAPCELSGEIWIVCCTACFPRRAALVQCLP
jgi:hypothetical protein